MTAATHLRRLVAIISLQLTTGSEVVKTEDKEGEKSDEIKEG